MVAALAPAVDHLFIRQHGLELFAPPDGDLCLVREAAVEEAREDPLRPPVVLRVAGRELAIPVIRQAEHLELPAVGLDVRLGELPGMDPGLDGVLLCRQPEGVKAHRVQDVTAAHPRAPGDDVAADVPDRVSHVESGPRGIGEHVQDVELRTVRVEVRVPGVRGAEGLVFVPLGLPALLDLTGVVCLAH